MEWTDSPSGRFEIDLYYCGSMCMEVRIKYLVQYALFPFRRCATSDLRSVGQEATVREVLELPPRAGYRLISWLAIYVLCLLSHHTRSHHARTPCAKPSECYQDELHFVLGFVFLSVGVSGIDSSRIRTKARQQFAAANVAVATSVSCVANEEKIEGKSSYVCPYRVAFTIRHGAGIASSS